MNDKNIKWIFNPPASPWMGGVWESSKISKGNFESYCQRQNFHRLSVHFLNNIDLTIKSDSILTNPTRKNGVKGWSM